MSILSLVKVVVPISEVNIWVLYTEGVLNLGPYQRVNTV